MNLIEAIAAQADGIAALRRDIHAHPETAFEEHRTADLVARKLAEWGIPCERGLGGTGVVGIVKGRDGGQCGRAIALRADMDALPMSEANTFAHASRVPGKMHACGHDGHTAMLLAAAQYLAAHRDFDGTIYLCFQPAEEGGFAGAAAMLRDGLFDQFPAEAVFGLHNWPGMPAGALAASAGPVMASSNQFRITIHGKGGHAALPHLCVDPVPIACQMALAFQTIVTRNRNPVDAAVISVTMIHAGETSNIIPGECLLQGTVRAFTAPTLDLIERRMREIAEGFCASFGARCTFEFLRQYPPTINTEYEAAFARRVMQSVAGDALTLPQEPALGAEDFAFMLQARPGAYGFIGNGNGEHRPPGSSGPCTLHNPNYDFNDALIPIGATYWVRLAQAWLAHQPPDR